MSSNLALGAKWTLPGSNRWPPACKANLGVDAPGSKRTQALAASGIEVSAFGSPPSTQTPRFWACWTRSGRVAVAS